MEHKYLPMSAQAVHQTLKQSFSSLPKKQINEIQNVIHKEIQRRGNQRRMWIE